VRAALAAVLGVATVVGAVAALLASSGTVSDSALLLSMAVLVGVVGVIGALVKLAGSGPGEGVASAPWEEAGVLVERAPERSPAEYDLSGERLAGVVAAAGEAAREDGTVAAGVDVIRPHLREALMGVFVQGGTDRATAEATLAEGTWTDDATAAAVLDDAVDHPGWSMLQRFEAWLFPEQVLREEVRRAMQAIATVADRELPTVPGQHAPRTVPVLAPTLEDLRRGADGHLQRAVEPLGGRTRADVDDGQATGRSGGSAGEEPDDGASRSPQDDPGTANPRRDSATDSLGDIRIGAQREDGVADDTADDEGEEVSRR
jgi:hypothetical protein